MAKTKRHPKKNNKIKTKNIASLETTIDKDLMKEYLDAATMIDASERDVAIEHFISKYAINIDIVEQIVKKIDESLSSYHSPNSSALHDETRFLKINIYHHTLHKLLPLCKVATNVLKEKIIQENYNNLLIMMSEMANKYSEQKLHGEQFLEYYNYIKEKTQWYHEYAKAYFTILFQDIKKNRLSEEHKKQLSDILSMHDNLLDFYHCHTSLINEKAQLQSLTLDLIENVTLYLNETIQTKEQLQTQSKIKLKRQSNLEEQLKKETETLAILSHYQSFFSNSSSVTQETLTWCLFLDKIQSIYKLSKESQNCILDNIDIAQINDDETFEKYILRLDEIIANSTPENLSSNLTVITNMLNVFLNFSDTPIDYIVEIHSKILDFLEKNTPERKCDEDDKAYLIHHVGQELFIKIKEKILNEKANHPFDINQYLDYAKILDIEERNNKLNAFFNKIKGIKIDNTTFSLIMEQIKNRPFSTSYEMMDIIKAELENVNIWNTTLKKIFPLCGNIDKNLELELMDLYFSTITSTLGTIIQFYTQEDLKTKDYMIFLDNIKEKIQWLILDIEKHQNIKFDIICENSSLDQIADTWNEINNIFFFYSQIIDSLRNQSSFYEEKNQIIQEADKFLNQVTHYLALTRNLSPSQEILNTLHFIEHDKNKLAILIKESNVIENNNNFINVFFEQLMIALKKFNKRALGHSHDHINIDLNIINKELEELLTTKKSPEKIELNTVIDSISSAITFLDTYAQLDIQNHTKEIITKHNSLCKAILELIDIIKEKSDNKNELIFKISKLFIKDIYLAILNDLREFSSRPVVNEIPPPVPVAIGSNEESDVNKAEESLKKMDLNSAPIIDSYKESFITLETVDLAQENSLKLKEMDTAYEKKMSETDKMHRTNLQKQTAQFQLEKIEKRKKLKGKLASLKQNFDDELKKLQEAHQIQLKEIDHTYERLYEASAYEKNTKYMKKELELQYEIVNYIENKKTEIRKDLSLLDKKYGQQFLSKLYAIQVEQQTILKKLESDFSEVLKDLAQAQIQNLLKFETYVSDIFQDKLKIAQQAIKDLQESVSDYNVNDIARIIHNHSIVPKIDNTEPVIEYNISQPMHDRSIQSHEPIYRFEIPASIKFLVSFLKDADIEFYFIGGFVRNQFLRQWSARDDINIIVNADASIVKSIFKDKVLQNINRPKLVTLEKINFWCDPWGNDLVSALLEKDLTMNTLIANMDGKVFNLLGINVNETLYNAHDGRSFLTIPGNNADDRFKKDPSLILRCLMFAASLHKFFHDDDWNAMFNNADRISDLPTETYLNNIERMFCGKRNIYCFSYIQQNQLLPFVFPFLTKDDVLVRDSILDFFIKSKLTEYSYTNDTSPLEIIALMMMIPIMNSTSLNAAKEVIETRLQNKHPRESDSLDKKTGLLNKISIVKSVISYCLGGFNNSKGYIEQYIDFHRQYTTPIISQECNVINQNPLIINQYHRHSSARSNTRGGFTSSNKGNTRIFRKR